MGPLPRWGPLVADGCEGQSRGHFALWRGTPLPIHKGMGGFRADQALYSLVYIGGGRPAVARRFTTPYEVRRGPELGGEIRQSSEVL